MDGPYTQDFIDSQKQKLLEEKTRLEADLREVAAYNEDEGKYIPKFEEISPGETEDNEEAADEVTTYEENTVRTQDLVRSLDEVTAALRKIAEGTYGICEETGQWISEERLKAYPAATTRIDRE